MQASTTYEYTSMRNLNDSKSGFWGVLARKAKTIFEEEDGTRKAEMFGRGGPQNFRRDSSQTSVASVGVQVCLLSQKWFSFYFCQFF